MRAARLALLSSVFLFAAGNMGFIAFQDSFDTNSNPFVPNGSWVGSYCTDGWRTDLNGGISPNTDDGCPSCGCSPAVYSENGNACIESDPFDNHIQAGSPYWQNYVYSLKMKNVDDDTFGVVFRYVRTNHFYLFMISGDQVPNLSNGCSGTFSGARLIRIRPDSSIKILKSDSSFVMDPNLVHQLRVTVSGQHIKIEFDKNGDSFFEPGDVFFDADDNDGYAILRGKIGLFSFENGVGSPDEASPCAQGGCYFDDIVVDLLPPNNSDCEDVPYEGICDGNELKACSVQGTYFEDDCDGGCCGFSAYDGLYTCLPYNYCGDSCQDSCTSGQKGCSSNLTHTWSCVDDGDEDSCFEPQFTPCPEGQHCSPATAACVGDCTPACLGVECGADGCGGVCGNCDEGFLCADGVCKEEGEAGQFGAPCWSDADCASGLCVMLPDTTLTCSVPCQTAGDCPTGAYCEATEGFCVPSGTCYSDCSGKECGDDGCGGSCGSCQTGAQCAGGLCMGLPGTECGDNSDCLSSLCLPFGQDMLCTMSCSTDAGCIDDWKCIEWLTGSPLKVCVPPVDPYLATCEDISACIDQCEGNPGMCISGCYLSGTSEAQAIYAELYQCIIEMCQYCGNDDACFGECAMNECFSGFAGCFPGTTTCEEALGCIQQCGDSGGYCTSDCYSEALPVAKKQLLALFGCLEEQCGGAGGSECVGQAVTGACAGQYQSCLSGCTPECNSSVCGPDGCGGVCGYCETGRVCVLGACQIECEPKCDNLDCGPDGCGGACGVCNQGMDCIDGKCVPPDECLPHQEKVCIGNDAVWLDSCGIPETPGEICEVACVDGECVGEDKDAVVQDNAVVGEADAWSNLADQGTAEFSGSGSKGGGCSTAFQTPAYQVLSLFAAMVIAIAISRFRRDKRPADLRRS